ncbi:MAG: class I SAM-dependent methyltransferase [Acidiferrobacter sp.]
MEQKEQVAQQFGPQAQAYLDSPNHAVGADLEHLAGLAHGRVLDLGCGAGHVSYAMAPCADTVVAYDLSAAMLTVVAAEAARRGLSNITTQCGVAESLPFPAASFDWVVTRFSAHHWRDVATAIGEAVRVLKTPGRMVVIDVLAPESALEDTVLQTVEILRDASHVRNYRQSEWRRLLTAAGLRVDTVDLWKLDMAFGNWIARMRTPACRVQAIEEVFAHCAQEVRDYFHIQDDGSFQIDVGWISATLTR